MALESEEASTEFEPFLDEAHHANDIELGDRSTSLDGAASGDNFNQFDSSRRSQENRSRFNKTSAGRDHHVSSRRRFRLPFLSSFSRASSALVRKDDAVISRWILRPLKYLLMFLGTLQLLAIVVGIVAILFPNNIGTSAGSRGRTESSHWPTDFTADILPVRCHSHNDYWRNVPLFSALEAGCVGVEADVWLIDSDLYVGHTESSLTPQRTFKSLYVNPLVDILAKQNPVTNFQPILKTPRNGLFDTDAEKATVLLVDFKTNGDVLWPVVLDQLEPLRSRGYLTHFNGSALVNGPIIVVATGNAPFHKVVANMTYRDVFFDAPLPELAKLASVEESQIRPSTPSQSSYDPTEEQAYLKIVDSHLASGKPLSDAGDTDKGQGYSGIVPSNPRIYTKYNSYYASTSLSETIGSPFPYFSPSQRQQIAAQIQGAHIQGLQVRYWGVPSWPVSWRHYLWRELIQMGIDYLNVDDLVDATKGDWLSQGSIARMIWGSGSW